MELAVFFGFALLAVVSALAVVLLRDPVKATMSLVATLFAIAVLFVLLGAPFIATLQILVYAGAILVLFLFVLMLLNVRHERRGARRRLGQGWLAIVGAVLFAGALSRLFWHPGGSPPAEVPELTSLVALARLLFTRHLLQFEIVGLLLLAAVVAASLLARRPPPAAGERSG